MGDPADGITGIPANKLVTLGPQLAVAQVLPREQIAPVRHRRRGPGLGLAVDDDLAAGTEHGPPTLFNAADPGSELAEFDWSPSRKHVCRLLAARSALDGDTDFAALTLKRSAEKVTTLLTALGWPTATLDEARSVSNANEIA